MDQIYTMTTDNGVNMLKAVRILSSEYGDCNIEILEEDDKEHDKTDCDLNILEEIEMDNIEFNSQSNILTDNKFLN